MKRSVVLHVNDSGKIVVIYNKDGLAAEVEEVHQCRWYVLEEEIKKYLEIDEDKY